MNAIDRRMTTLSRIVSHLRRGEEMVVEWPSAGVTGWSTLRLRLSAATGERPRLEIAVMLLLRSGSRISCPWNPCDWTIDDLARLHDDMETDGVVSSPMCEADPADDVTALIAELARTGTARITGVDYAVDDDCVSVVDADGLMRSPDRTEHPADAWITQGLSKTRLESIRGRRSKG